MVVTRWGTDGHARQQSVLKNLKRRHEEDRTGLSYVAQDYKQLVSIVRKQILSKHQKKLTNGKSITRDPNALGDGGLSFARGISREWAAICQTCCSCILHCMGLESMIPSIFSNSYVSLIPWNWCMPSIWQWNNVEQTESCIINIQSLHIFRLPWLTWLWFTTHGYIVYYHEESIIGSTSCVLLHDIIHQGHFQSWKQQALWKL